MPPIVATERRRRVDATGLPCHGDESGDIIDLPIFDVDFDFSSDPDAFLSALVFAKHESASQKDYLLPVVDLDAPPVQPVDPPFATTTICVQLWPTSHQNFTKRTSQRACEKRYRQRKQILLSSYRISGGCPLSGVDWLVPMAVDARTA